MIKLILSREEVLGDLNSTLDFTVRIVSEAAHIALRYYGEEHESTADQSIEDFSTIADKEVHKFVIDRIAKSKYAFPVVSEEMDKDFVLEALKKEGLKWVLDPIDGSINFSRGIDMWSISFALVDGIETIAGVVYDPVNQKWYVAAKGLRAYHFRGIASSDKYKNQENRMRISSTNKLEDSVIILAYPYNNDTQINRGKKLYELFHPPKVRAARRWDSAALEICAVAAGKIDAYICNSQAKDAQYNGPWDIAAAMLILKEAGGRFTDYGGQNKEILIADRLATNEVLHGQFLEKLKYLD